MCREELGLRHIVVMGVCGCGKSVVAKALAEKLDATFVEGDAFHPASNIESMKAGHPLSDEMRFGWLNAIADAVSSMSGRTVIACSALKQSYRDRLTRRIGDLLIVHLTGDRRLLETRVAQRTDHFMPVSLVESQFAVLEVPSGPNVIEIDVAAPIDAVVEAALTFINSAETRSTV